jgi:hypothetical protein
MQTSFQLVSSKKPTSDTSSTTAYEYNRGIFKIDIPALLGEGDYLRRKMRSIMYVSVDASGSMEETATRPGHAAQTKMDFVHMTLTNMIEYIASQEEENPHVEFYIAIVSFDSSASCALLPCRVTRDNKDQLIATVKNIRPRGGTNFQKCFQEIARLMSTEGEYIKRDEHIPEEFIQRMHIFLTDGANNEGEKRVQQLATLLTPTLTVPQKPVTQIIIGYGPDHDSTMLQSLCAQFPKSKQWFIDDVEKTGCIFGEILWSAANTAYAEVKLSTNVEFYDFTSMSWKNEIQIDDLIYDSSRTFYVRVPWSVDTVVCEMTYFSTVCPSNTSHSTQSLLAYTEDVVEEGAEAAAVSATNQSVEQELWRLDTITTVNEALTFLQNIRRMPYNTSVEEKNRLIGVVTAFQEKFLAYVVEKGLSEDPFMIQLADDLFVCISGLMAASVGERYIAARQASQIQQRSVTVNDITPLQTEILFSMPSVSQAYGNHPYDDDTYARNNYPPAAPRRTHSGGGCVDDDTRASAYNSAPAPVSPRTPTRIVSVDAQTEEVQETEENKENDKLVSDFTPSSRGVGSRLRHLSREAIIGLRGQGGMYHEGGDEGDYYSCRGGAADDTFSSHASPGCARIGRMLSAQTPSSSAPDRTHTAPY